jgi:predicted ATPase
MTDQTSVPIREFSIKGLHGYRDITIPFDAPVKVLVAENGSGKTTVLNTLHSMLSGNFLRLRNLDFESITLKFSSGREITVSKQDVALDPLKKGSSSTGLYQHFKTQLSDEQILHLVDLYRAAERRTFLDAQLVRFAYRRLNANAQTVYQWTEMLSREIEGTSTFLLEQSQIIKAEFPYDLIYLPTYRRIEEDLRYLGEGAVEVEPLEESVMQFGMHDVLARIDSITREIKDSSLNGFGRVNGQMLGQLLEPSALDEGMKASLRNKEALKIVLHRTGESIPERLRMRILQLADTEEIFDGQGQHDVLAYFLANLVKVYEQQKENDDAIKRFVDRSNGYLVNKRVIYDENAVDIAIKRIKSGQKIQISKLSSGEKQILSLFSRLFLVKHTSVAIFFDEPELSLSVEWQKQLLPHILESGICGFLFSTTHSPFIFDNDVARYTSGLDQYTTERE